MKNEFLELECAKVDEKIPLLDYIYVIQTRRKHDSGYYCMEIIGANNEGYKRKLSTFSDVIDLDEIFGSSTWCLSIDIPEYNVMRLFSHRCKFKINSHGISTFSFDLIRREDYK